MKLSRILAAAALLAFAGTAQAQLQLNELFVSHTGTDDREFIEIRGPAGTALTGFMILVVEGETGSAIGALDIALDLSAGVIPASGLYTVGGPNVVPAVNQVDMGPGGTGTNLYENGTETIYLIHTTNVAGMQGLIGQDIRNPPGSGSTTILVSDPAVTIHDKVGLLETTAGDTVMDNAPTFTDGTFLPAGIQRCGDSPFGWNPNMLNFNYPTGAPVPPYNDPTPTAANPTCGASTPGTLFCPGDDTGTLCPCANPSPAGNNEGCLSSLGIGARLRAVYNVGEPTSGPSLTADGDGSPQITLNGDQMPNSSCLYFQGTSQSAGGAGTVFGDGLRCAAGTVIRLDTETNVSGASSYPNGTQPMSISLRGSVTTPGTRTYQAWYRNAAAFCTPSTFNVSNGLEIVWGT